MGLVRLERRARAPISHLSESDRDRILATTLSVPSRHSLLERRLLVIGALADRARPGQRIARRKGLLHHAVERSLLDRLGEQPDDLLAELWQVVGLSAGDELLVRDHWLVDPLATGVRDVGAKARPRGEGTPAHLVHLDEQPRTVTDGRDRLVGIHEAAHEAHG